MKEWRQGSIKITLDGEERWLRFPNRAMRQLQERFKVKTPEAVWQKMRDWTTDDWTFVMALGLQCGSEPEITEEQVDDMILGTETPYYQIKIQEAVMASLEGRELSPRMQQLVDKRMGSIPAAIDKAIEEAAKENPC